ncbi:MAG: tRNA lysidine(34) synthetase TilS [Micrococcales bacterium]|nr:tRNA lysidine(34) synthetase TilS [Micrococcales bacterium]
MVLRNRLTPAVADVRRALRQSLQALQLEPESRVLVACSGGPDSMALAAAAAFEAPKLGLRVAAVIVDHGLQEQSAMVAAETAKKLDALGLDPVVIEKVSVSENGSGPEAAARDARYQALERARVLVSAELVLLGHNLEDQAETVLLGLTRGSGLRSIAGMQMLDAEKKLLRPLLQVSRETLRASCQDQDIEFWTDPHNSDPKFTRVRIRQLLENLEHQLGPGFADALSRTAEMADEADAVVLNQAKLLLATAAANNASGQIGLTVSALADALPGIRRRAIFETALAAGAKSVSRVQVLGVDELITNWHGQKKLALSGITVERVGDRIVFTRSVTN